MRLATFNLKHSAYAEKYPGHPRRLKTASKSFKDVDILALQEVDRATLRSGFRDLSSIVAKAADMQGVFVPTRLRPSGIYGNALLIRGEIEDVEVLELGGDPRFKLNILGHNPPPFGVESRNAILATAHVGGRQISVAATHLSTERETGKKQLSKVLAALALRPEPRVLLGDLNQGRRQVLDQPLLDTMELAYGRPTFPVQNPKTHIDHIAVQGLTICNVETRWLPISDHLALVADVE